MKPSEIKRKTKETDISIKLYPEGMAAGKCKISTGIGFFDHMLTAFSVHSGIPMEISVSGDLHVDGHHTVEDTGIALGQAMSASLGNKSGIKRYGTAFIPMDEALGFCSLDISNRPFLVFNCDFSNEKTGGFELCLVEEFFRALAVNAGITLHLAAPYGKNDHHKCEAVFKAFAHAFRQAIVEAGGTLSTKGSL